MEYDYYGLKVWSWGGGSDFQGGVRTKGGSYEPPEPPLVTGLQRSIPVQTPSRKFRGSLCSLPRELTKVTPSGVKVNLAEKIIFFILLISAQLIHFYCVALIL